MPFVLSWALDDSRCFEFLFGSNLIAMIDLSGVVTKDHFPQEKTLKK